MTLFVKAASKAEDRVADDQIQTPEECLDLKEDKEAGLVWEAMLAQAWVLVVGPLVLAKALVLAVVQMAWVLEVGPLVWEEMVAQMEAA